MVIKLFEIGGAVHRQLPTINPLGNIFRDLLTHGY